MSNAKATKYPRQEKLMHRRQVMNLTRAELAEKSGVCERVIVAYERGERLAKLDVMTKLAQALGCTIDEIVVAQ